MKPRMLLALAMLLVLLMAGSVPAAADGSTVPFKAFYAMSPHTVEEDAEGCLIQQLPGVGEASHLGRSTWYSDARTCLDPDTMAGSQSGTSIFTSADGAQLIGTFLGEAKIVFLPEGAQAQFSGTYWITEGTGRLTGYTGTGDYWGTATLTGTGELYFQGTLKKPEKP